MKIVKTLDHKTNHCSYFNFTIDSWNFLLKLRVIKFLFWSYPYVQNQISRKHSIWKCSGGGVVESQGEHHLCLICCAFVVLVPLFYSLASFREPTLSSQLKLNHVRHAPSPSVSTLFRFLIFNGFCLRRFSLWEWMIKSALLVIRTSWRGQWL